MESTYEKQANDFLLKTGATLSIEFLKNDYHFDGDTDKRDIYKCVLSRGRRSYSFNFGNSLHDSQYYQDIQFEERTYTMDGRARTGNYEILNVGKYQPYLKLIKGIAPSKYSILACLQKYDVGTFEDFCSEFGYDTDSRRAKKTYKAVVKEWQAINRLFSDEEIEEMQEIQ